MRFLSCAGERRRKKKAPGSEDNSSEQMFYFCMMNDIQGVHHVANPEAEIRLHVRTLTVFTVLPVRT